MNGSCRWIVILLLGVLFLNSMSHKSEAGPAPSVEQPGMLHDIWLKIKKIEALVTLMQEEQHKAQPVSAVIEPLREHDLQPSQQINLVQTKAVTPGMEPAKQPTQAVPVQMVGIIRGGSCANGSCSMPMSSGGGAYAGSSANPYAGSRRPAARAGWRLFHPFGGRFRRGG